MKRFFRNPLKSVHVKICGIKNETEAMAAIASDADALGFNLYPGSKRFLDLRREEDWIRALPPEITRIAVLVNPPIEDLLALIESDTFDAIQLHGDESPDFFKAISHGSKPLIKAFRLKNRSTLKHAESYPVFAFLLDSYRDGFFGGTGERFDWAILDAISRSKPIVVAGGLTVENVGELVRLFRPHAVDVASGVENNQGRKEEIKIREFVLAAKLAIGRNDARPRQR
ncbi:MAG TPA: phosphoribosylanthranilate isomerase [Chthoniobacterales bacterium]|nr:phosphoribosylanthranilate isomerase [Chthoniobacterales bacterium]